MSPQQLIASSLLRTLKKPYPLGGLKIAKSEIRLKYGLASQEGSLEQMTMMAPFRSALSAESPEQFQKIVEDVAGAPADQSKSSTPPVV